MKALRYLLIAFAAMMVVNVQAAQAKAQSMAQEPQIGFQSTSSMVGSGSTLPQAVQTGAYTTYDEGVTAPAHKPGVKTRPPDWEDPYDDPIGDAAWPLALCALAYLIMRVARRRKRV